VRREKANLPPERKVPYRVSRLAAIDVGTNTVRMLVAEREGDAFRTVARFRRITGMGRRLRSEGAVGKREFAESLSVLREFRRRMRALDVVEYRACGTAALREASNRDDFLAAASAAGVKIEVVSAGEEAARTWEGVRSRFPGTDGTVVMDIGGGSTEFIVGPGRGESVSLSIGVVVVCGIFPISDPPCPWQIRNLRCFFSERIRTGTAAWGRRRFRRLVGTAGTFTTLAALDRKMRNYVPDRIDGWRMSLPRLRLWERRLSRLTEAGRLDLPGMERGRERYIVPGTLQAVAAMERFGLTELVVSDAGLLEGILRSLIRGKGERG
jgi:exopolyphosphatase/guanosine-5'-triphosphate,3'-diphosphate pyrophosphatase